MMYCSLRNFTTFVSMMVQVVFLALGLLFVENDTLVKDTIEFTYEELALLSKKGSLTSSNGVLHGGSNKDKKVYQSLHWKLDSIIKEPLNHYSIILGKNHKIIEEGWWNIECFKGPYKKYHCNGKLAEAGCFADPSINSDCFKIGVWYYYNRKGKLIKEKQYDMQGKLLQEVKALNI